MGKRYSLEVYVRMRERVNSGSIQCGSGAHMAVLDYERERDMLPRRDKEMIRLAEAGWAHATIAEQFGISRSRVSHIIDDWLSWNEG